jgi:hypothetical protein
MLKGLKPHDLSSPRQQTHITLQPLGAGCPIEGTPWPDQPGSKEATVRLADLQDEVRRTRKEWIEALRGVQEIIRDVPSHIPHPDGALRMQQVLDKRQTAYERYKSALETYTGALMDLPGCRRDGVTRTDSENHPR